MSIACELSNTCFYGSKNDIVKQCTPYNLRGSRLDDLPDCEGYDLYEKKAIPKENRSHKAHSYCISSPGKAQPRSRSTSSEPCSSNHHDCKISKTINPQSSYTICEDKRYKLVRDHYDAIASPIDVCLFVPQDTITNLSKPRPPPKRCVNVGHKSFASIVVNPEAIASSQPFERQRLNVENSPDNMFDSVQSNRYELKFPEFEKQRDENFRRSLTLIENCLNDPICLVNQQRVQHLNAEPSRTNSNFSLCENSNRLALFSTDIYQVKDYDKAINIQQNRNTNSGVTVVHKPRCKKIKARQRVSHSHSSSSCSLKSNSSWEDNGAYDDDRAFSSISSKGKNRATTWPSKHNTSVLQTTDNHISLEPKQFWEKMTRKLKPNEIAIGVGRKGKTYNKMKSQVHPKNVDANCCLSNCKNNSSYIYMGNSVNTSSRRCRSMCSKSNTKRSVSPRGVSVNASSSDEGSQRHRKGRTVQIGNVPKPKASKTKSSSTPPRASIKSPTPKSSKIPVSNSPSQDSRSRSPSPKSKGSASRSKSPVAKGKGSGSRGKSPPAKGKSTQGKRSHSIRASAASPVASAVNVQEPISKPTSAGPSAKINKKKADVKKSESANLTQLSGIVPLTPAEICERCKKYRLDQELGECVPLDFSHVQQLEKLAQTVNEESTRQLLKTVTAIVEEKVCKQMFRHLMPCDCPGCKNRPNICENLDKFFGKPTKPSKEKLNGDKDSSIKSSISKGGKRKSKNSPKNSKRKSESSDSSKKIKSKSSLKSKEVKSDSEEKIEEAAGDNVCGDSVAVPSLACCRTPPCCLYDRDYCSRRNGCHYTSGWSNSSMRLGWWPGNRARYSLFDRCWSNYSGDKTQEQREDSWVKPGIYRSSESQISRENSLGARDRAATDEANNNIKGACFAMKDEKWAGTRNFFESQEPFYKSTRSFQSDNKMSEILRRYGTDSSNSCPHDNIEPCKTKCQHHNHAALTSHTDTSRVRDPFVTSGPELHSRSWGKLVYGDEESANRLDALISSLDNLSCSTKEVPVSQEIGSKNISPNQKDSCVENDTKNRLNSKKVRKRSGFASQNSSPTTKAVGEIEARTKALLSEAKLGYGQANVSGLDNSKQVEHNDVSTSFIREYSPISPPDVNTAYSTNQCTQAVSKSETEPSQNTGSKDLNKLWWDGLPEKPTRTFNSVFLKKYSTSSAMPVSVQTIGKSQAEGTPSKPPAVKARSRSEPRLTQVSNKGGGAVTVSQARDKQTDSAKKTGSYTVCKGRPGKQNPKGKPVKKLWKY